LSTLVLGLNDRDLRRIASELDVDEVLTTALGDLAERLRPVSAAWSPGGLVLDVVADDATATHVWSIGAHASPGAIEPVALRLGVAFPLLLQLLAGTVQLADA